MTNKELTRQEVADIFGVTPQTISNWVEKGLLEGVKTKNKVFISSASVDNLLAKYKEIGDHENEIEEYRKELLQKRKELKARTYQTEDELYARENIGRLMRFFCSAFNVLSNNNDFSERAKTLTASYLQGKQLYELANEFEISPERARQIVAKSINRISRIERYESIKNENDKLKKQVAILTMENKGLREAFINEENIITDAEDAISQLSSKAIKALLKHVEEAGFSRRTYNCLRAADIDYIYQLVQKSRQYLMRCRNFGRKSLNEIDIFMDSNNLWFNMSPTLIAKVLEKYNL